jgi:hypothetical protein
MNQDELIADGLVSPDEAMRFLSISRPTLNRFLAADRQRIARLFAFSTDNAS